MPAVGVLIANVGTPRSAAVSDVRAYLREFLSDPRIVRLPRALWLPLLHGIILPFRAPRSAQLYARVWTPSGSPLLTNTLAQRDRLRERLGPRFQVEVGMRYGAPTLRSAVEALLRSGCEPIVVLPMFPQYSHTTTGSLEDAIARLRSALPWRGSVEWVAPYFADPAYVRAVADRARSSTAFAAASHTVFSFHGIPRAYVDSGDPYRDHCEATARALAAELALPADAWSMAFQSRFGPQPWLEPLTEIHVPAVARRHERVAVVLPGFAADCLETLEEIEIRLRERFTQAGGRELIVVPALNDSPAWIDAIAELVRRAIRETRSSTS